MCVLIYLQQPYKQTKSRDLYQYFNHVNGSTQRMKSVTTLKMQFSYMSYW